MLEAQHLYHKPHALYVIAMLTGRYRPTRTNVASKANGFGLRDTRLFKLPSLNQHCRILLPDKFWHKHGPRCLADRIALLVFFQRVASQYAGSTVRDEYRRKLLCALLRSLRAAATYKGVRHWRPAGYFTEDSHRSAYVSGWLPYC